MSKFPPCALLPAGQLALRQMLGQPEALVRVIPGGRQQAGLYSRLLTATSAEAQVWAGTVTVLVLATIG